MKKIFTLGFILSLVVIAFSISPQDVFAACGGDGQPACVSPPPNQCSGSTCGTVYYPPNGSCNPGCTLHPPTQSASSPMINPSKMSLIPSAQAQSAGSCTCGGGCTGPPRYCVVCNPWSNRPQCKQKCCSGCGCNRGNNNAGPTYANLFYCNYNAWYQCATTSQKYVQTNAASGQTVQNGTQTCSQALQQFYPGQTTGVCFTDQNSCNSACHPPAGTVQARAWIVPSDGSSTCGNLPIASPSAALTSTLFNLIGYPNPSWNQSNYVPAPIRQTSSAYVAWNNAPALYNYNLRPVPPAGYVLQNSCWASTMGTPTGTGLWSVLQATPTTAATLTWDLGYSYGAAWPQASGADVYATTDLQSMVPAGSTLISAGTNGAVGVATYGQTLAIGQTAQNTLISSTNWSAKDTAPATDYYQLFLRRFGGPAATPDYDGSSTPVPVVQPASRATPYVVNGSMITSGSWSVGAGQTIIFLISGNLEITAPITKTGNGFVAFIVNGDITVDPSVGVAATSSSPSLEGIYVTSPAGVFHSSKSTVAGAERLVVLGTVVAGNFDLARDLGATYDNTTSAELFEYDPQLLITMPDAMRESHVVWQEVAP